MMTRISSAQVDSSGALRGLIWLMALTLAIRVGVLWVMPGALAGDPDGYRQLARNLIEHGTLGEGLQPTAYRPPLYPLLLAPCVAMGDGATTVAIGGLHVLLGLGTVWLVWRIGQRCGLGRWALLAGGLVACDPILLGQSRVVMTETAAAFFVALALLALVRAIDAPSWRRGAAAGVAMGLCGLCRPELLLWAAVCVLVVFLVYSRRGAMIVVVGVIVVLLPWAVRNQIQFGRPIVATTHGGYTLLLANNASFYEFLREGKPGTVWDARGLGPVWGGRAHFDSPAAELAADRQAYAEAWQNIRQRPGMFAYSCLARAGRFWALAPHQGSAVVRWAIRAWYLVVFLLAAVGILFHHGGTEDSETVEELIQRASPCPPSLRGESSRLWLVGLLLAITMTAVHAVYWSDMRMRAPLVPVVALAAAGGIAWLWGRVRATQGDVAQGVR